MRISDWSSDVCSSDLSVSEGFGNSFIAPRLAGFVAAHPEIEIDLVSSSGFLNPSRREADMAVLLARPRKGPLRTRKLADYSLGLYAPAGRPDWQDADRKCVVQGERVPVRVDLGGRRIHKLNNKHEKFKLIKVLKKKN